MRCSGIGLVALVLAATLSMTIAEFVEFQKLSPEDLRARFGLPAVCDPSVTASTPQVAGNNVTVGVECRPLPGGAPASTPPRPARSGPRGS
jgi:hypothetical protein